MGFLKIRQKRDAESRFALATLLVLAAWCGFNWFDTIRHAIRYYDPLPTFDYWRVVEDLPSFQKGNFGPLWRLHNQHRIILPEIAFAVDALVLRCRQVLPLLLNVVLYAGSVLLCLGPYLRDRALPGPARAILALLLATIAGWPLCVFVLGTAFLLQWVAVQFFALLAFTFTVRGSGVAVVALCAAAATFTSLNGLLLWPIVFFMAFQYGWPRRRIMMLAITTAVCLLVFAIDYHPPAGTPVSEFIRHPLYFAGFVLSYLGMPFGNIRHPAIGLAFGICAVCLWAGCFIHAGRQRLLRSETAAITLAYGAFLILTAAATAVGRLDPESGGFLAAKAGRFVTTSLLGWAVLLPFVFSLLWRAGVRARRIAVSAAVTVAVLAFMQIRLGRWLRADGRFIAATQAASLSIESGLEDDGLIRNVFPDPSLVRGKLATLRSDRISIFADREARLLGQILPPIENGGTSAITSSQPISGGLMVKGRAYGVDSSMRKLLLITNEENRVVGFGRHISADSAATVDSWVGFANSKWPCSRLMVRATDNKTWR